MRDTQIRPVPSTRRGVTPVVLALLALAGCDERGAPVELHPDAVRPAMAALATSASTTVGVTPAAVPADARLVVTTGNQQSGTAGGVLLTPLGVRLLTPGGQPVVGAPVVWTVVAGGGTLGGVVATTDAFGVSRATAELGATPGTNTVRASVGTGAGAQAVTFTLRGVAPPSVATLVSSSGDGQRFAPGFPLEQPLVVRAVGPDGRGVPNAVVRWSTPSGGTFRSATTVTNVLGYAFGFLTLGAAPGTQTATATVAGLAPVVFRAQADPAARPVVATISLGLGATWLEPGERSSVYAAALSARGLVVPGTEITWSVDRPDVLTLQLTPEATSATSGTSRLEFTARAAGDATITVVASGVRRSFLVRVFPPGGRPRGGTGCGGCG